MGLLFGFELNRIISRKKYVLLCCFVIIILFSAYSGFEEIKNNQNEKTFFSQYEKKFANKMVTYTQHGDYGFRIFYQQPTLYGFFFNSGVFDNIYSNIDMTEIVKINKSYKGRNLFSSRWIYSDYAGLFYFFASFFMMYMGISSYKNEKILFRFQNILMRILILSGILLVLFSMLYFIPKLFGVSFSDQEALVFFKFSLYQMMFFLFFYSLGVFLRTAVGSFGISLVLILCIWIFITQFFPQIQSFYLNKQSQKLPINEMYNYAKLEEVMNFERDARITLSKRGTKNFEETLKLKQRLIQEFYDSGYQKNLARENEINLGVKKILKNLELRSVFNPVSFYTLMANEASANGYSGYIEFMDYIMNLRRAFVDYIVKMKFTEDKKPVIPFVKAQENIFEAKPRIPKYYWQGLSITALYTIILFLASYFIIRRRLNRKKETFKPDFEFEENGEMVYILCENEEYQEKIFNYYQEREDCICIDKVRGEDIDPGLSLKQTALYFCKLLNARVDRTFEHIEQLGITDIKTHPHTPEAIKKIYCAACMAVEKDIFVFKDFLDRESRDFEVKFRQLLKDTIDMERNFIYIRKETPKIDSRFTAPGNVDKYALIPMSDPREFIIR